MQFTTLEGEVFESDIIGPEQSNKGILIIHDWWGILDYNRQWAMQLAQLGYRTMILDLYHGYRPADAKAAGEYMRNLDQEMVNRKLHSALLTLKRLPHRKIATLGWSFGGLQAQHAALQNPELVDATIFFYCRNLINKNNARILKGAVLAFFAEAERTWPDKQAELEYVMADAEKTLELHSYDADHGFVNPESPRYDSEAAESAWHVTLAFLDKHLA